MDARSMKPVRDRAVAMAIALMLARAAAAQSAASVGSLVAKGDQVALTTTDGVIHEGRVLSLTTTTIELQLAHAKQKETVPVDHLRRIETRYHDRVTDGLTFGLIAGAAAGVVIGALYTASDCHDRTGDDACTAGDWFGSLAIAGGVATGAGGLMGSVADAMHSSVREVWRAPAGHVSGGPMASIRTRSLGAQLTIRW